MSNKIISIYKALIEERKKIVKTLNDINSKCKENEFLLGLCYDSEGIARAWLQSEITDLVITEHNLLKLKSTTEGNLKEVEKKIANLNNENTNIRGMLPVDYIINEEEVSEDDIQIYSLIVAFDNNEIAKVATLTETYDDQIGEYKTILENNNDMSLAQIEQVEMIMNRKENSNNSIDSEIIRRIKFRKQDEAYSKRLIMKRKNKKSKVKTR